MRTLTKAELRARNDFNTASKKLIGVFTAAGAINGGLGLGMSTSAQVLNSCRVDTLRDFDAIKAAIACEAAKAAESDQS